MTNNQFTIKELNYIAKQLSNQSLNDFISDSEIEAILPEDKKSMAKDVLEAMKEVGLIDETLSALNNFAILSVANIRYYSENEDISKDNLYELNEKATEKLLSGQIQNLDFNEYFIIDGFKLYNDSEKGVVLSPINEDRTLPPTGNIFSFLKDNNIKIDCIDLNGKEENIEGILSLSNSQPATKFVEFPKNEPPTIMEFLSLADNIEQSSEIYFYIKDIMDQNEIENRITQMDNIVAGDIILSDGAVYVFTEATNGDIECKAVPLNKNTNILESFHGIDITPEEMSVGDDVLGENINITPPHPAQDIREPENTFVNTTPSSDIEIEKRKFSNSPYFGDGVGNVYNPNNDKSVDFAKTLNSNEQQRIAAEIKINNLYAEKNKLKMNDKYKFRGIIGFLRNLIYRPIRGLIYLIARPFVKDLPLFSYNSSISDINKQIRDTKDAYFNAEQNTNRFIKQNEIDIEEVDKTNEDTIMEPVVEKESSQPSQSPTNISEKFQESSRPMTTPSFTIEPTEIAKENNVSQETTAPTQVTEPMSSSTNFKTEHKISYPKMFKQIVEKVAPPNTKLHLTTQKSTEKNGYTKNVTFIRPDNNGELEEIKLTMDKGDRELVSTTATNISKETLTDLSERVLVAQQLAREKAGQAGISEESWNKSINNKPSKSDMAAELITGEAKVKNFFVNGIKLTVEALDNGNFSLSALGGNCEVARESFTNDPRNVINTIAYNMAVNKYIGCVCEQIPQKLENSAYLDKITANSTTFSSAHIDFTKSGRPIASIPMTIKTNDGHQNNEIVLDIIIDTNSGKIQTMFLDESSVTPDVANIVNKTIEVTKGVYAGSLLSTVSADIVYGEIYADRVRSDIQKVANDLKPNETKTICVCGIDVDITKEVSGTVTLDFQDTYGKYATECSCYNGKIPLMRALQVQDVGRLSMEQDKRTFEFRESKASTTKMTDAIADFVATVDDSQLHPIDNDIKDFIFDEEPSIDNEI